MGAGRWAPEHEQVRGTPLAALVGHVDGELQLWQEACPVGWRQGDEAAAQQVLNRSVQTLYYTVAVGGVG